MIKRFHEAPLSVFDVVRDLTDGDYFLVHLFEENDDYWSKAVDSVARGRHTILDNSIFELEEAFDSERFLYWVNKMQPTEYIIPDVLEDTAGTCSKLGEWLTIYQPQVTCDAKTIGVVQGRNFKEIAICYMNMEPYVDKIAISFDYSFMCPSDTPEDQKLETFMRGRQKLLADLLKEGVINQDMPHHLLGCFLPQEFAAYKDYKWIESLDTSNPVMAGYKGMRYTDKGLKTKPKQKLFTIMNEELTSQQIEDIIYNIDRFEGFCK